MTLRASRALARRARFWAVWPRVRVWRCPRRKRRRVTGTGALRASILTMLWSHRLALWGAVSLEPVPRADGRRWEAMMERHHPAGWRRAPGGQLRYWITSSGHGVLGGIGFVSASCQLAPRDAMIGWSADACLANIAKVVCNQRFLLLPSVRVRGLASHVLRLATRRIAHDWAQRYGVRPNGIRITIFGIRISRPLPLRARAGSGGLSLGLVSMSGGGSLEPLAP